MKKIYLFTCIAFAFFACSSNEQNKNEPIKANASDISISQEKIEQNVVKKTHKKELENDDKGFYYSLKNQQIATDLSDETFTRIDAQKNVQNKYQNGKILEKTKQVDTPYNYIKIDLLKNTLSKNFIVKCSSCHDDYANGIIGPSLLHKDGEFIYNTLMAYKTKQKANILMQDLVKNLKEKELKSIAYEIAKFNEKVRMKK